MLPEAQLDRSIKLQLGYPSSSEEVRILDRDGRFSTHTNGQSCDESQDIATARSAADKIIVDDRIKRYTVDVVNATAIPLMPDVRKQNLYLENGFVRASINLIKVAKARASCSKRPHLCLTTRRDQDTGSDVLRHRIQLSLRSRSPRQDGR